MRRLLVRSLIVLSALVVLVAAGFVLGLRLGYLGPPAIPLQVVNAAVQRDGPALRRALALPSARGYQQLLSQSNGSLCGPASLVNVERSLGHAVANEQALLSGSGMCRFEVCLPGLTLDELAALARTQTQRDVSVLRDLTPQQFREHLLQSNDAAQRYVINFSREPIFGQGGGHHSPIGGYLQDEDMVLVLDVNGRYGPWLVPADKLYAAMDTLDGDRKRGMLRIR